MKAGFTRRLLLALLLLLLAFGGFVTLLVRQVAQVQEQEALQRLSHGLAQHIVAHWPVVSSPDVNSPDSKDRAAREELLRMLMAVNPGVQVYVLDADGRVDAYIGAPGMVRVEQVDLAAVRAFLAGARLPLKGTDPMGGANRIFSAAMFPPQQQQTRPPGYLYVVLDSGARAASAAGVSVQPAWRNAAWALGAGLLATLCIGAVVLFRLTLPLNRLARRMREFDIAPARGAAPQPPARDEVQAIGETFDGMASRIREQVAAREEQNTAHREVIANVAHDLRTPLTALHGHLEALGQPAGDDALLRHRLVSAALAQSDKVRRLSQQLFELATLQSTDQVLHRESFRLDELVTDTVQKFELITPRPMLARVALAGAASGPIELSGDLHLIERALTNLIDNAVRHAPGPEPVRVSLLRSGPEVTVLVEDQGPGLPPELARRLDAGQPVRDPPLQRPGGGIGGLGLAIAQRIASLHGGSLRTQYAPGGGTRLVLALPCAQAVV